METVSPQPGSFRGMYVAANIEDELAAVLNQAADDIGRAECFDVEQRAEVYAILQALQTDQTEHRKVIKLIARQRGESDA